MPVATKQHWTERSIDDFVHKIATDFVAQIETKMDADKMSRQELAGALRVSAGRVSQVLNNPGNLTMRKIVEYSRILGMKVAIVAYEDGDPHNQNGPINSEIFYECWKNSGQPNDLLPQLPQDYQRGGNRHGSRRTTVNRESERAANFLACSGSLIS